jgi:diguanylate cyclase (GGDEF)-like protein
VSVVTTEAPLASEHRRSAWRVASERRSVSRAEQRVVIVDGLGPFCGIGSIMFALAAGAQFAVDPYPGSWPSSFLAAVASVVLGAGFLLLHSPLAPRLRDHALPFAIVVAVMGGLNPFVYILGTRVTYPAIGMLLMIVAVGALVHDWLIAALLIIGINLAWILCAVVYGTPVAGAVFASQIVKATALAIVLNVVRLRTVRRYERARAEVHRLATTDGLTGLANQRGFFAAATSFTDSAPSDSGELTIVYVDIDGLKPVNDQFGHAAGDALIQTVGEALRRAFRPQDTIARVGGDEFAVMLVGPGAAFAEALVERVNRNLAEVGVSTSIGTASGQVRDLDLDELLRQADAAMYRSKIARKRGDT